MQKKQMYQNFNEIQNLKNLKIINKNINLNILN